MRSIFLAYVLIGIVVALYAAWQMSKSKAVQELSQFNVDTKGPAVAALLFTITVGLMAAIWPVTLVSAAIADFKKEDRDG